MIFAGINMPNLGTAPAGQAGRVCGTNPDGTGWLVPCPDGPNYRNTWPPAGTEKHAQLGVQGFHQTRPLPTQQTGAPKSNILSMAPAAALAWMRLNCQQWRSLNQYWKYAHVYGDEQRPWVLYIERADVDAQINRINAYCWQQARGVLSHF